MTQESMLPPLSSSELMRTIRAKNLEVYRADSSRLRQDVGIENQIAQDYRGRLFYELLQNADDSMADCPDSSGVLRFVLTPEALWVANSGRALTEPDVQGLCGISASSKSPTGSKRRASIGHKGMGFKSVLEITDAPEVYSSPFSFGFRRDESLRALDPLVQERVIPEAKWAPITRFPWEIPEPQEWQTLAAAGMTTGFRFPLKASLTATQRELLAEVLRTIPVTALIFLKNLRRLEIVVRTGLEEQVTCWDIERFFFRDGEWQPGARFTDCGLYRVVLRSDTEEDQNYLVAFDGDILLGRHRGGLDEMAWDGIEYTEISLAVRMEGDHPTPIPSDQRRFHVFLPTAEPCPYPFLVSGAFASNLSRQEIRVEADETHYNGFLLREAARLVQEVLLPFLQDQGVPLHKILALLGRDRTSARLGSPGDLLSTHLRAGLADCALIPSEMGERLTFRQCVVPPVVPNGTFGRDFRALLAPDAGFEERLFPTPAFCRGDIAPILVDHGAYALTAPEAAQMLAQADADRTCLQPHASGKLSVDPVLTMLERLWRASGSTERQSLEEAVRRYPLFPTGADTEGRVHRIITEERICFYPPRTFQGEVPLPGLCFLLQAVCWGKLTRRERGPMLQQELSAWNSLFRLQEFGFAEVIRTSVLPLLAPDREEEGSAPLRSLETLAAICQLSGDTVAPEVPLPFERMGSNRAIFPLCRLKVPCQGSTPAEIEWVPAYRAYFGEEWIGEDSVQHPLFAAEVAGREDVPAIRCLIGPDRLAGLLSQYRHLDGDAVAAELPEEDGASPEGDGQAPLAQQEVLQWKNFFRWLGVSLTLRLTPFHSVEDSGLGWLNTGDLQRPQADAFQGISSAFWEVYRGHVDRSLREANAPRHAVTDAYFYHLHHLEHLDYLLQAAEQDTTGEVGRALYIHLARNWERLGRYSHVSVAQVKRKLQPRLRRPAHASDDELSAPCENFWLFRLQHAAFCPTRHGPRRPDQTWLPGQEVERLFERRSANGPVSLLPVLEVEKQWLRGRARGLATALRLRDELSPARFNLDDARALLHHLQDLYAPVCAEKERMQAELRQVIRPAYRNLMEMLVGSRPTSAAPPLADCPLLVQDREGELRFEKAQAAFYLDRRETRERLAADGPLWTFVLEATAAARTPLANLFGIRFLEEVIVWVPCPGDPALDGEDLERFARGVQELAPYILSRLEANREAEDLVWQDIRRMQIFMNCVQPVRDLELRCHLRNVAVAGQARPCDAFVDLKEEARPFAFVRWGEHPWPPGADEAEALARALCDIYGANYYESFLTLIRAESEEERRRLLRRVGAPLEIEEKQASLQQTARRSEPAPLNLPMPASVGAPVMSVDPPVPSPVGPAARPVIPPRTRLYCPEQLLVAGKAETLEGVSYPQDSAQRATRTHRASSAARLHAGYGGHTDLEALDALGMYVTLTFECSRLRREGLSWAELFDPSYKGQQPDALVFDVSHPGAITCCCERSPRFKSAFAYLNRHGVGAEWPGCDVITLDPRKPDGIDRLIELKSSGVHSQSHELSWKEWQTASSSGLRRIYHLYLVGNLRTDVPDLPFLRTIQNPVEQLEAEVQTQRSVERRITLQVKCFRQAEHLNLTVLTPEEA